MNASAFRRGRSMWSGVSEKAAAVREKVAATATATAASARQAIPSRARMRQQWRQLPGDIGISWWVLFAEVLAVVVLLWLALVAGPVATRISGELDTMALATLSVSDPRGLCVQGFTDAVYGHTVADSMLALAPIFKPRNKTVEQYLRSKGFKLSRVPDNGKPPEVVLPSIITQSYGKKAVPDYPFNSPNYQRGKPEMWHMAFEQRMPYTGSLTLNAMWGCKLVVGAYADFDLAPYVAQNCSICLSALGLYKPEDHDILSAQLVKGFPNGMPWQPVPPDMIKYLGLPDENDRWFTTPMDVGSARNFTWATTFFLVDSWYWPDSTDAPDIAHIKEDVLPAGLLRIDAEHHAIGLHSLWLKVAEQNRTTAACLAKWIGDMLPDLDNTPYTFIADHGNLSTKQVAPAALGLEVAEIWLVQDVPVPSHSTQWMWGSHERGRRYTCAGGIDMSALDANTILAKQAWYRSVAKSRYNVTMFGSMRGLAFDDVYAVYTAILGALFGAFALLVTTLFFYVSAFAWGLYTGDESTVTA